MIGTAEEIIQFDYQSDRHCAKTEHVLDLEDLGFDYQSDRHCAKTNLVVEKPRLSLITSQIDTAPKP